MKSGVNKFKGVYLSEINSSMTTTISFHIGKNGNNRKTDRLDAILWQEVKKADANPALLSCVPDCD